MLCTYFAPCVACALRGVPTTECMSLCSAHPSYSIVPEVVIDSGEFMILKCSSTSNTMLLYCLVHVSLLLLKQCQTYLV